MYDHHPTVLSSTDYARLQGLMCTLIGSRTPLAAVLRRKLGSAVIMLPSDAGPDLVSSGRRVRFIIDGNQPAERALVWQPQLRGDTAKLSLRTPRGLALLGLRIGDSVSYPTVDGRTEHLEVEYVFPEDDGPDHPSSEPGTAAHVSSPAASGWDAPARAPRPALRAPRAATAARRFDHAAE